MSVDFFFQFGSHISLHPPSEYSMLTAGTSTCRVATSENDRLHIYSLGGYPRWCDTYVHTQKYLPILTQQSNNEIAIGRVLVRVNRGLGPIKPIFIHITSGNVPGIIKELNFFSEYLVSVADPADKERFLTPGLVTFGSNMRKLDSKS
jgi:hypothetical protein